MKTLQLYRNTILNPVILVTTILITGLLVYNFIYYSNHKYESYINIFILTVTIACAVTYIFRKRVFYNFRVWLLIFTIYIDALFNFYIVGYSEIGSLAILLCIVTCFVFFNLRKAIIISAFLLLTVIITFILFLNNIIPKYYTVDYFINSNRMLCEKLMANIFIIGFISTVLYFFIYYFINSMNEFEKTNKELEQSNAALLNEIERRTQLEQTTRLQEYKFKTIFDNLTDGVLIFNYNFDILEANNTFYKRSGYTPEEIDKIKFPNFLDPEQRDIWTKRIASLKKTGTLDPYEYSIVNKNNQKIVFESNASLMTYDNNPVILSILRDITKRKNDEIALFESEEKFRNLFNSIQDTVVVIDFDLNILEVNNAFVQATGILREEALKLGLSEFIPEKHVAAIIERMKKLKSELLPPYEGEFYSKRLGKRFPLSLTV